MANGRETAKLPSAFVELLYQALETELCGVDLYRTAIPCTENPELLRHWETCLAQTNSHVHELREACIAYGLNPNAATPGRAVVRRIGSSLIQAIEKAMSTGDPTLAELVAAECVLLAETKDRLNWRMLSMFCEGADDRAGELLADACADIEEDEDDHFLCNIGWARTLWEWSLGLSATAKVRRVTKKQSERGSWITAARNFLRLGWWAPRVE